MQREKSRKSLSPLIRNRKNPVLSPQLELSPGLCSPIQPPLTQRIQTLGGNNPSLGEITANELEGRQEFHLTSQMSIDSQAEPKMNDSMPALVTCSSANTSPHKRINNPSLRTSQQIIEASFSLKDRLKEQEKFSALRAGLETCPPNQTRHQFNSPAKRMQDELDLMFKTGP